MSLTEKCNSESINSMSGSLEQCSENQLKQQTIDLILTFVTIFGFQMTRESGSVRTFI